MTNFKVLAVVAICASFGATAFAEDACCAHAATGKMTKDACAATFANMNLNATQKAKMEKLAEDCAKGGCNEATTAKMEEGARGILSKEQFAAWRARCSNKKAESTRS